MSPGGRAVPHPLGALRYVQSSLDRRLRARPRKHAWASRSPHPPASTCSVRVRTVADGRRVRATHLPRVAPCRQWRVGVASRHPPASYFAPRTKPLNNGFQQTGPHRGAAPRWNGPAAESWSLAGPCSRSRSTLTIHPVQSRSPVQPAVGGPNGLAHFVVGWPVQSGPSTCNTRFAPPSSGLVRALRSQRPPRLEGRPNSRASRTGIGGTRLPQFPRLHWPSEPTALTRNLASVTGVT